MKLAVKAAGQSGGSLPEHSTEEHGPKSLTGMLAESGVALRFLKLFAGVSLFVTTCGSSKSKGLKPAPSATTHKIADLKKLATPTTVAYPGSLIFTGDGQQVPTKVFEEMVARVDRASRDGLSGDELARIDSAMQREHGPVSAAFALREVLGTRLDKLDESGVDWLQRTHASIGGHVKLLEHVLKSHLANARLIDADFDGKLGAGDVAWTKNAAGRVDVQKISAALADRVKVGASVVRACLAMLEADHEYSVTTGQSFNNAFWRRDNRISHFATFHLKAGVKPSAALEDIFANPKKYRFECASALIIVYYKAMLDLLGPKDFDRICGDLKIGPWEYENDLGRIMTGTGSSGTPATSERQKAAKVGEYVYTKNWDVSWLAWMSGLQGENEIKLTDELFYGHYFGVRTQAEIEEHLNDNRKPGSSTPATMTDRQGRLDPQILREDRTPD